MTNLTSNNDWAELERTLGVRFQEQELLRQALTHSSFLNEQEDSSLVSYDRLEYLGDAFLGWVVARELYASYPRYDEGDLSRARAALVRGETLAEIAQQFDLGAYLFLSQGEESGGGRSRTRNLAAALEAVLGAVLIDQGEQQARELVIQWLGQRIKALGPEGAARDAKSALQEAVQRKGLPLPAYEIISETGPPHARWFTVRVSVNGHEVGNGAGSKKAEAEQAAAAEALASMT